MKLHRINAIILHHIYFWYKSMPRWLDIFYWPIVTVVVWGFISSFVQGGQASGATQVATYLLGGVILWMLFQRAQQDLAISYLQDIWSRSIVNLYVSPLTNLEFIIATVAIGILKVIITLAVMGVLAALLYSFNIFTMGFSLLPFIGLLLLFAWALGLFVTGIIFRYGTDAQVLAFGISFILQPIAAVFYPLSILPHWIQPLALAMPITHVFEGMRATMATGIIPWSSLLWASGLNIIYLIIGGWYFVRMFNHTKKMGLLAKLE
ncbi:MAG: ABC transporter permease [Candidatus Komeilibacteria bacterium]|nr:ABC transporter permease [Candidatus Komeilibacteria bacterium]